MPLLLELLRFLSGIILLTDWLNTSEDQNCGRIEKTWSFGKNSFFPSSAMVALILHVKTQELVNKFGCAIFEYPRNGWTLLLFPSHSSLGWKTVKKNMMMQEINSCLSKFSIR